MVSWLKKRRVASGNTKEEKRQKQIEENTKEFIKELKAMEDTTLQELYNTLKGIIENSEDPDNVSAAMSQNRAIIAELFSRKQESETIEN